MIQKHVDQSDANLDPLSGTPGAHPLGTGVGAVGGGVTGAALGAVVAGPLGAMVGAAVGGIAGGLAGKGAAEAVNPTVEDVYWSETYASRPYVTQGTAYAQYAPAYRYGWESRGRNLGKRFDEVETSLEHGWDKAKGDSKLAWSHAKEATRDAWHRVDKALPGGSDHDGR